MWNGSIVNNSEVDSSVELMNVRGIVAGKKSSENFA